MNLFGLERSEIERAMLERGLPAFRGRQICRALYARGVDSFESMTELPKKLRADLARDFEIRKPRLASKHVSRDGTVKHLVELADGRQVECVDIPEPGRHTFCLSTQVGCPLQCSFCFSGTIRFERNLAAGEIVGQLLISRGALASPPTRTNVVFMGMG
jgi:23S rRNA (adenine2503-C2)-methyltransferase